MGVLLSDLRLDLFLGDMLLERSSVFLLLDDLSSFCWPSLHQVSLKREEDIAFQSSSTAAHQLSTPYFHSNVVVAIRVKLEQFMELKLTQASKDPGDTIRPARTV